jgi:hypothetical protein
VSPMLYACLECGRISETKRCPAHGGTNRSPERRTSADRSYGRQFRRNRTILLARDPICVECGLVPSVVADHEPSRRVLLARGVEDPDALEYLRALCLGCHRVKSGSGR